MSADEQLVPHFMPPLAAMLARAEQVKGSPLTEAEVVKVRHKSSCIMMKAADAAELNETRGYRDVNPENCWADWHRLRVQMTGKGCLPKIVLCIPGHGDFPSKCEPILDEEGIEHELKPRDRRMVHAFEVSSMARPSLTEQDYGNLARHEVVLYAMSRNFMAAEGPETSHAFLRLGRRLLEAGGIAIKSECSGIACSCSRWIELADQAEGGGESFWAGLFDAFVVFPIGSKTDVYSCGMHLLGKPDLIVSQALLEPHAGRSVALAAASLFRVFGMYLLAECPDGGFVSGNTFSVDQTSPRYRVIWEPCTGYAEDEFFFNPFGRWRFTAT
jgi:hypothetical protein